MEENREQPTMEPANVINITEEESAVSEVGSQGTYGKFKSAEKLLEAYNNLESEFTKKCQLLSELQKDKRQEESSAPSTQTETQTSQQNEDDQFSAFLLANEMAKPFEEEIKEKVSSTNQLSPYEVAWAKVVLGHLNAEQKTSDPIVNNYVLSDENVRKKLFKNILATLLSTNHHKSFLQRVGKECQASVLTLQLPFPKQRKC